MTLVPKLTFALVAVMGVSLAVSGWLRVVEETRHFEAEHRREHNAIATSLAVAVSGVWTSSGERAALDAVVAVNDKISHITIRWIPIGGRAQVSTQEMAATKAGEPNFRLLSGGNIRWYTYVNVDVGQVRRGAIELDEESPESASMLLNAFVSTIETAAALAAISAGLAFVLSRRLVGRPIDALIEKARSIGRGDFFSPLVIGQRDEFGTLAQEMNRTCDRLARTLGELRHADRLATIGKVAAGLAHELGTPLNVVSMRAEMIERSDTDPDETRAYASAIGAAAARMTGIVRQLMHFARNVVLQKEVHDVAQVTRAAIALIQPLADKEHIGIEVATDPSPLLALVDYVQLQQVVTNLVMNAIQAMSGGGLIRVSCTVATTAPSAEPTDAAQFLCLRIDDEGCGMSEEVLSHIFEPFFSTKGPNAGTGLGLAVAYGIVTDHGGFIEARSELARGSTLMVYLPRSPQ